MDFIRAMNAVQNPQGYLMQLGFQQAIKNNPNEWNKCQQMFAGKSRSEQVKNLRKLYKDRGLDLEAVAKQYGVQI